MVTHFTGMKTNKNWITVHDCQFKITLAIPRLSYFTYSGNHKQQPWTQHQFFGFKIFTSSHHDRFNNCCYFRIIFLNTFIKQSAMARMYKIGRKWGEAMYREIKCSNVASLTIKTRRELFIQLPYFR